MEDQPSGRGREALAVAGGSVLGAAARWALGELVAVDDATTGAFPWSTLLVNLIGCAAIGWAAMRWTSGVGRAFAVTGVLGGFTTMSAFAAEVIDLSDAGRPELAAIYVAASLTGGVVAAWSGGRLGAGATS